jgi:spore germination protein KC
VNKKISLIVITAILCTLLSGCYDRREVDEMAYVTTIGLDKGRTNRLLITLQIAIPRAIGGSEGGGGKPEEAVDFITLEAPTLYAGLNMANGFVTRQLNLSHTKALVFSKEFAQQGIDDLILALPRGREFRPSTYVVVSRSSAEDYVKALKPKLESNPAKYLELIYGSHRYTGFTANSQFHYFYSQIKALYIQPVAILAGLNETEESEKISSEGSTYRKKGHLLPLEGDFLAGTLPRSSETKAEVMGLAVFDGGKMVGELDGADAASYLMTTGKFNHAYFTMPDPQVQEKMTILDVKRSRKPQRKVDISGDKPRIEVKLSLEADILVIQSGINYEDPQKIPILEKAYEDFIREETLQMLERTAKEYHSDICGFGSEVKSKFLTWKEWENYGWLSRYSDSTFQVEVDLKIRRPGLVIKSSPIQDSHRTEGIK